MQLLLTAVFLATLLQVQAQLTESQQAVQQTVIKIFDALSNRDSVSLKKYAAPDILLFEYGMTWTIDTLIMKAITLNQAVDFKRINKIDFINTVINGNTAWATYNLNSEITRDTRHTTIQWLETVVLVKAKTGWKVKVLHSSLIKRN